MHGHGKGPGRLGLLRGSDVSAKQQEIQGLRDQQAHARYTAYRTGKPQSLFRVGGSVLFVPSEEGDKDRAAYIEHAYPNEYCSLGIDEKIIRGEVSP
jgi:hypothetical protein